VQHTFAAALILCDKIQLHDTASGLLGQAMARQRAADAGDEQAIDYINYKSQ